jgi:hypothetical protein
MCMYNTSSYTGSIWTVKLHCLDKFYIYWQCTYIMFILQCQKVQKNYLKRGETSIILIVFYYVLYHIHTYTNSNTTFVSLKIDMIFNMNNMISHQNLQMYYCRCVCIILISTTTNSNLHSLNIKTPWHVLMEIKILTRNRHKNVEWLNWVNGILTILLLMVDFKHQYWYIQGKSYTDLLPLKKNHPLSKKWITRTVQ